MIKLILSAYLVTCSIVVCSHERDHFQEWCDTHTAQGLLSLAANRIYGTIDQNSAQVYELRSSWVNAASKQAEVRFQELTGHHFLKPDDYNQESDWFARCQTKSQIN